MDNKSLSHSASRNKGGVVMRIEIPFGKVLATSPEASLGPILVIIYRLSVDITWKQSVI